MASDVAKKNALRFISRMDLFFTLNDRRAKGEITTEEMAAKLADKTPAEFETVD